MIIKIAITMFEDQFDNNASLSYGHVRLGTNQSTAPNPDNQYNWHVTV